MAGLGAVIGLAVSMVMLAGVFDYIRYATTRGMLGRNQGIGIRTKRTMASERAWQAGHRAAAPWLWWAARSGYVLAPASVLICVVLAALDTGGVLGVIVGFACFAVVMSFVLIGTREAGRAAASVAEEQG
ncbi:SdpI family protein [Actinopolyspora halophila]|uniref:SdpI family protein n=1 Tax=Actinopolyspora halophila TaxID=1850 RepID=UPI000379B1EA|nr:SdpI family protein [Actinopolyspora halophila]